MTLAFTLALALLAWRCGKRKTICPSHAVVVFVELLVALMPDEAFTLVEALTLDEVEREICTSSGKACALLLACANQVASCEADKFLSCTSTRSSWIVICRAGLPVGVMLCKPLMDSSRERGFVFCNSCARCWRARICTTCCATSARCCSAELSVRSAGLIAIDTNNQITSKLKNTLTNKRSRALKPCQRA